MASRSYYEILEVEETATDAEIKRAYRRLAMKYHPDKNAEGTELFKEISHAYETLSDPEKRAMYDQFGTAGPPGANSYENGFSMDDMYGDFFGGMFGDGFSRGPKAEQHPLSVSLEDLFHGKRMRMKLERSVPCKHCKGLGGKKSVLRDCFDCGGKGHRIAARQVGPGLISQQRVVCQTCGGSGKVVPEKYRCRKCKGSCIEKEKDAIEINISPGMADGQTIVLKGKGDQHPGMQKPLDLVFVLEQKPHSTFTRAGDHLVAIAEIDLAEALCGFSRVLVTHLNGHPLEVSHKSGVLRPGDVLCINNEGMPREQRPRDTGDLFIKLSIRFPEKGWAPDLALRDLLPATRWSTKTTTLPESSDVELAEGRAISTEEFDLRTKQKPSSSHHHHDNYDSEYDGYENTVPECQPQ